jgi:hypothetical protein
MKSLKIFFISVNLIMTALICFSGVDLFYYFLFSDVSYEKRYEKNIAAEKSVNKKDESESLTGPLENYSSIYSKNLFGTLVSKVVSKPEIDISSLDKTALNLKLLGTVVGFENNYAVILSDNRQGLYSESDEIKDATVKRIFRQKVQYMKKSHLY